MAIGKTISGLDQKYGVLRAAKFGLASAAGFLIAEALLTLGVFVLYGKSNLPSNSYSSPTLVALNVVAFGLGVTAGFFINESITVKNLGAQRQKGIRSVVSRLLKFQLAYLLGNVVTVGVQLALLAAFSITPILGNIAGAIAAYPVSYFISMRYVWKVGTSPQFNDRGAKEEAESIIGVEPLIPNHTLQSEEEIRSDLASIPIPHFEPLLVGQESMAELTKYKLDVRKDAKGIMIEIDAAVLVRRRSQH